MNLNPFKRDNQESKELKLQRQFLTELKAITANASTDSTLRGAISNMLSGGYDFADILHQIYQDFGYPAKLSFNNYWNMYSRFGVAQAVCEIPVDITWKDTPVVDGGEAFNKAFESLAKKTKLWKRLKGLDNRQRVGRYGGLFIRVRDSVALDKEVGELSSEENIVSLKPLFEGQLKVAKTVNDVEEDNFGNPVTYDYMASGTGSRNEHNTQTATIHASRIITWAEGSDDDSLEGKSSIESNYNDLMDLRKVSGAGGEGFYQNTRSAPVITTKEGYKPPKDAGELEKLETEMDEFLNKWRKKFVTSGFEFNYPDITLDNPEPFYNNSMNNISAGSKIPSKLIMGNQTGRLAGDSDLAYFLTLMNSRRENFASEGIETVIGWFVEHNVLPAPINLTIEWDDLLAQSEADKTDIAKGKALAFKDVSFALSQPALDGVVEPQDALTLVFGEDEIEEIAFQKPDDGMTDDDLDNIDLGDNDNE